MLHFLGLSALPQQQETSSSEKLDHLDEPTQKQLFDLVAKQVVKTLGIDEAAKYVSFFLQKKYETVKPKEVFENVNSFVVVFANAVLEAADYPNGTNRGEIFSLLKEYTQAKSQALDTTALAERIVRLFNNIPNPVITMLLPAYHSFIKNSTAPDKDKRVFRDVFFDRFFSAPMQNSPNEPDVQNLSVDYKIALLTNAKALDPFKKVTDMLDVANTRFTQIEMNKESVNTGKTIFENYHQFFKLRARVTQLSGFFRKLADTFNLDIESTWGTVYLNVATQLEELGKKLTDNAPNKTSEALKVYVTEGQKILDDALKAVVKDPLDNFSCFSQLEEEMSEFQQRVFQLKTILSNFKALYPSGSPAGIFYHTALTDCSNLFQELAITLVYNVVNVSKEQIWEEIEACQIKVSQVVARFINEPIDGVTPLHRLVMSSYAVQQDLQRQLEFLLQQGALTSTTTTYYERKKGLLSYLSSKQPMNVEQLAKLYGNDVVLAQALASIEAKENETARKNTGVLEAIALATSTGSRPSSTTSIGSHPPSTTSIRSRTPSATMAVIPEPELPLSPQLSWQRSNKRDRTQRTPEATPRHSGDNTTANTTKSRRMGSGSN